MRKWRRAFAAGVLASSLGAAAHAHDTWMLPERGAVARGAVVHFDVTSGMGFPVLDTAIKPERVARAAVRLGGKVTDLAPGVAGPKSLRLSATLAEDGLAAVWLSLGPRTLELTPAQVEEYMHEIGAAETIGLQWKAKPEPKKWRETYAKHAKTFVRVGTFLRDESWKEPVGQALELVPAQDPTSLTGGDTLTLHLLRHGVPLAGLSVAARRADATASVIKRSDGAGSVAFSLDRPGRWMIAATELRPAVSKDVVWESDFATLTLEVAAAGQRPGSPRPVTR